MLHMCCNPWPAEAGKILSSFSSAGAASDSWDWWNQVRCMCAHNGQLGIALTLGAAVPSHSAIQRWFGEPVRAVVVPTSTFQNNKRGFPALPKAHQAVLLSFFQLNVQVGMSCNASCCRFLGIAPPPPPTLPSFPRFPHLTSPLVASQDGYCPPPFALTTTSSNNDKLVFTSLHSSQCWVVGWSLLCGIVIL